MSQEALSAGTKPLVYVTLAISLLLIGGNYFWLAKLQSTVNELVAKSGTHAPLLNSESELFNIRRAKRESGGTDDFLGRIVREQLKTLAVCTEKEKFCVQGQKGDAGLKGDKGDTGLAGGVGQKGSKGDEGSRGQQGDKGDPGSNLIPVDPPILRKTSCDVVGKVGSKAVLECVATGYPKPVIRWKKKKGNFPENAEVQGHQLVFENVQPENEGFYICVAENIFGIAEKTCKLSIIAVPTFTKVAPKHVTVLHSNPRVHLPCEASGFPTPNVTWYRRNESLPVNAVLGLDGSLRFAKFGRADEGTYVCLAENENGIAKHATEVLLYHVPIKYGLEVVNNTEAVIHCSLCPFENLLFDWSKVNGELPPNRTKIHKCSLKIAPVQMEDAGEYSCRATMKGVGSVGELEERATLVVLGKPRFSSDFPQVVVFNPGENVTVNCSAYGPPIPKVSWLKGEEELVSVNSSAILNLSPASVSDEGIYCCFAKNYFGDVRRCTALAPLPGTSPPRFTKRPPRELTVSTSKTVWIDCQVERGLEITWTGPCGVKSNRMNVLKNGTLVIRDVTAWDTGVYECSVSYVGGRSSAKTHLVVPAIDTSWKLSDSCSGFRQSRYNNSVYYQASSRNSWDKSRFYYCPKGYHWACTSEGKEIFGNNNNWSNQYVYRGLCGWSGYNYYSSGRIFFRFRDSSSTYAHKHAGNFEEFRLQYSSTTSQFAGIVCIAN